MSKSQRRKGADYELEIANALHDYLGIVVRRNIGQSRDGGDDITLPPYRLELKRRAKISTYEFMEQCERACRTGDVPVVMMRADGEETLVVMRLNDWIKIAREEILK